MCESESDWEDDKDQSEEEEDGNAMTTNKNNGVHGGPRKSSQLSSARFFIDQY